MKPKRNVSLAMFDVRPTSGSGHFQVAHELDLRADVSTPVIEADPESVFDASLADLTAYHTIPFNRNDVDEPTGSADPEPMPEPMPEPQPPVSLARFLEQEHVASPREIVLREFEESAAELDAFAYPAAPVQPAPTLTPEVVVAQPRAEQNELNLALTTPEQRVRPTASLAASGLDAMLDQMRVKAQPEYEVHHMATEVSVPASARFVEAKPRSRRSLRKFFAMGLFIMVLGVGGFVLKHGMSSVTRNLEVSGASALFNLESAKTSLQEMHFDEAATSFAAAYDDFTGASNTLDSLGASFISMVGDVPGLSKVSSANNLVEAGRSIAKAGENLSLAFGTLTETNVFSYLHPVESAQKQQPLGRVIREFKEVLVYADKHIKRADELLMRVDSGDLPEDKRELFEKFRSQAPEFEGYIEGTIDYADFLLSVIGEDGVKRYIILFQNNTELRATGGFPGTYGLITFEGGYLKNFFVDDVYAIDGQAKKNIIPPKPLEHITPSLGMRDANWFADFPTSARKVMEYYELDGGAPVDGVLTITPTVIERMLRVVGPIEMSDYDVTLTADNFLEILQNEVEYEADREYPKQMVVDFQPKLFEAIAQQGQEGWTQLFQILMQAMEEKQILAYFNDPALQDAVIANEFGGQIKRTDDDYLQVVFTNVKGAKTDLLTDNAMTLEVTESDNELRRDLTISRRHTGGDSRFRFYNVVNSAYVRVYVPLGTTLESIVGNDTPKYGPLIDYEDLGFEKDAALAAIEARTTHPFSGVDVFEESGKTVFGFWMLTSPKDSTSVTLTYSSAQSTPRPSYSLLWQKQSGTIADDIQVKIQTENGAGISGASQNVQVIGARAIFDSDLLVDRTVGVQFSR